MKDCSAKPWPKIVCRMHHASRPSPSIPPLPFLPSLSQLSPPFLLPFPLFLRSRHPQLRLEGLGERSSSPGHRVRATDAKRILTHFRPKFAPFEYLMQLTDTLIATTSSGDLRVRKDKLCPPSLSKSKSSFARSNSSVETQ